MNLILFGFKACGKTTWGQLLASRLNCPFFDTDQMIEQMNGKMLTVREIYKKSGEQAFRILEANVAEQLKNITGSVIALGGGMILNPGACSLLAKLGQLVYLKVGKETLKKRLLNQQLPPFFDPALPEEAFEKYYNERKAKYEEIPALQIDLETQTQDQIVQAITALIEESHG